MRELVFTGGTVILPDRLCTESIVHCRDGLIADVSKKKTIPRGVQVVDLGGGFLSPGFIDIHVHGGQGADFMDGNLAAVRTACMAHVRHGTTTLFPTTTTGSPQQIAAMLAACVEFQSQLRNGGQGPNLAGVHLYGPYFAEDKVGCHSASGRRDPRQDEYSCYFQGDIVRIATCAAELPGAKEFYRAAHRADCFITCGHSNASFKEMQVAFKAGMRHVDHFWCAMSSVASLRTRFGVPMQASMTEFVLLNDEMSTEVIADGCHLSAELLEFAYRMKGAERLCLVTDCNRALDMPPGKYRFGNERDGSWLLSDGQVGWSADGQSLASSIVGMDHMVRQMKRSTTATLPEIVRMASLTPAERTGIAEHVGSIEVGKQADMLILSKQLKVKKVYVRGEPLSA